MSRIVPEFSRIVSVMRIPPSGIEQTLEAKPDERAALAERFDLVEIKYIRAQLTAKPDAKQIVYVRGRVEAEVVQRCVVTLEPLAAKMDLDVDIDFVPAEFQQTGAGEPLADDADEECEFYENGKIDLGEMIAQEIGINLDPYPRKADAALGEAEFGPKAEKPHPFAGLAALGAKKNKGKTDN